MMIPSFFPSFCSTFSGVILSDRIISSFSFRLEYALACSSDSVIDLYASCNCTYLPTNAMLTTSVAPSICSTNPIHFSRSGSGSFVRSNPILVNATLSRPSFCIFNGTRYIVEASIDCITAVGSTLQNRATLRRNSMGISCSVRRTRISGCTPCS